MTRTLNWVKTTGGPHVLIPKEQLVYWRGIEGWWDYQDPADQSDYARASRVETWLGTVPCNASAALVLSGDVGDVAWLPSDGGEEGFLVQWIGIDDESLIEPALRSEEVENLLDGSAAEKREFETGLSGMMCLIDASDRGDDLQGGCEVLALRPGCYHMRAAYYVSDRLTMVVRQISRRGLVGSDDS